MVHNLIQITAEKYELEQCFDFSLVKDPSDIGVGFPPDAINTGTVLRNALIHLPVVDMAGRTNMAYAFAGCANLTNIPELDTSNSKDFSHAFSGCKSLRSIPPLNTGNCENFVYAFYGCTGLTSIPQLDMSKGTNFGYMFYGCTNLTSILQLDTSNGTDFSFMFSWCTNLTSIPQLDTSNGTDVSRMFSDCKIEDVDSFSAPLASSAQGVFDRCKSLKTVGTVDLRNASNVASLFEDCEALTSVGSIRLGKATDIWYMFSGCKKLTQIPPIDVRSATDCQLMFYYCEHLTTLGAGNVPDADGNLVAPWQFKVSVNFGYCPLDKASIECVMNNLQTVSSTQTLTISKTTALNICGQTDRSYDYASDAHYLEMMSVCTDKGWKVAVNTYY